MRKTLLIPLLFIAFFGQAQKKMTHNIKMDFKLPTPIANTAWRTTNLGVSDVSLSYQLPLFKGVGISGGGAYMFMRVDEFALQIQNKLTNGRTHRIAPFFKIYYEQPLDDQFIFDGGVKVGYAFMRFESTFCTEMGETSTARAAFVEPYVSLYMLTGKANDNLAIGLILSYGYTDYHYNPSSICVDDFPGFGAQDYVGPMHNISVGFGFTAFMRQGPR